MLSYLRDPIWQFIGAILGLITIFLYFAQRKRKSLSCRVLAETKLFRHVNGKFQTTYEGRPVQNAFLIIIKVLNDGNVPILASDFAQELTFSFGSGVQVLAAEPIHASPEDLKPTLHTTQSKVTVQPLLLNSKDEFDIQILCDGYQRSIEIESRIVGVRELKFFKSSTQNNNYALMDQLLDYFFLPFVLLTLYVGLSYLTGSSLVALGMIVFFSLMSFIMLLLVKKYYIFRR